MIYNQTHISQHHIFRLKNTELNEIYTVMSIRSFIIGLIGIFIPIYLYTFTNSIQNVILFYLLIYFFEALFELPAALLMTKLGPKHNIALSLPILVFHFWLLWTLPTYNWPIWFIALTGGLTLSLFWEGYNFDFSRSKSKKKAANQVSKMYIIIAVFGAIAPFLGGIVASRYGFHFLFGLATALLLFAVFPLFSNRETHLKRKFNLFKLRRKKLPLQAFSYCGTGIESTTNAVIWPLFIFMIIGSYEKVGLVTSAALILTIVITYYVGKNADERGKCGYIKIGSTITAVTYFFKAFVTNIYQVFGFNIITSISHALFTSPFVTEYYLHADEDYRSEYIFLMELCIDLGRLSFLAILYILSFYLPVKELLVAALLLGGLATFLIGLMPDSRCEIRHTDRKIKVNKMIRSKA